MGYCNFQTTKIWQNYLTLLFKNNNKILTLGAHHRLNNSNLFIIRIWVSKNQLLISPKNQKEKINTVKKAAIPQFNRQLITSIIFCSHVMIFPIIFRSIGLDSFFLFIIDCRVWRAIIEKANIIHDIIQMSTILIYAVAGRDCVTPIKLMFMIKIFWGPKRQSLECH